MSICKHLSFLVLLIGISLPSDAQDITVSTFQDEYFTFAGTNSHRYQFPANDGTIYEEVLMHYTYSCPDGGCDEYDRYGWIWVEHPVDTLDGEVITERFELARIITPFGGSYSQTWRWTLTNDVTNLQTLLRDSVTIGAYIETWSKGWELTIEFEFTEGNPTLEPYKVENLWQLRKNYGVPTDPIENHLTPITMPTDANADLLKVRLTNTGHSFLNTDNAAEFSRKTHQILIDNQVRFYQDLWRSDCGSNPLNNQAGTWEFNRAGWCPGDEVFPDVFDITQFVTLGEDVTIDYDVQPYTNLCSPL